MIQQSLGLVPHSTALGRSSDQAAPLIAAESILRGFVYLSTSEAMPGFVRVGASESDPRSLTWSLESLSGATWFHTIFSTPSLNCSDLVKAFRRALLPNQVPHYPDIFHVPTRFARQILAKEAVAFAPAEIGPDRSEAKLYAVAAALALTLGASICLMPAAPAASAAPIGAKTAAQPEKAAAPIYRLKAPQLRLQ